MASWQDKIPTFNPYVQQLPVEAMVKVGMQKQAQYEEGVQKIQTSIDNVAGLDVARDIDKQYLQSKLDTLGNNLKTVAAGDFSNFQLVNSVNGMTKQISKDRNVINAVSSTATIRKGQKDKEEAKKSGKSKASNDWIFDSQVNNYVNSKELTDTFNGQYENAVDTDKPLYEALKAAHADKFEGDENVYNKDGSINNDLLNHKIRGGLSTSKVASIARSVYSDPALARQLQIDGLYNYKDYDGNKLVEDKLNTLNYQKEAIFQQTPTLRTYATLAAGDKQIQASKDLQSNYNTLVSLDKDFESYKSLALQNPDAAKTSSYMDAKIQQAIKDYSWTIESGKTEVNPQFTVNMDKSKFALDQQKFNETKYMDQLQVKNIQSEISKRTADSMLAQMKLEGKVDANGVPVFQAGTPAIDPEATKKFGSGSMYKDIADKELDRNQLFADITSTIGIDYNGKNYQDLYSLNPDTGSWQINPKYLNTDKSKPYLLNDLGSKIYNAGKVSMRAKVDATGELHLKGEVTQHLADDIKNWWDAGTVINATKQAASEVELKYKPQLDKLQKEAGLRDNYNYALQLGNGIVKNVRLSKSQLTDIALYKEGRHTFGEDSDISKQAHVRLVNSLGKYANVLIDSIGQKTAFGPGSENNAVSEDYQNLKSGIGRTGTKEMLNKRESEFAQLQRQHTGQELTYNSKDPASVEQVRKGLMAEYETIMKDKSNGGYQVAASMLEKMKGDPAGLANNIYKFRYDDKTGKWYSRIANLSGGGFNENATEIEIGQGMVNNLKLNNQLNPKEQYFNNSTIGQILNLSAGYSTASTTTDLTSPKAYVTALERGNIGDYSIGFHVKAKGRDTSSYIPYIYIKDKKTGHIYPHIPMDWSKLASLPGLNRDEQAALLSQDIVYDKTNIVPAIEDFKDKLGESKYANQAIKLLIGNYNKQ